MAPMPGAVTPSTGSAAGAGQDEEPAASEAPTTAGSWHPSEDSEAGLAETCAEKAAELRARLLATKQQLLDTFGEGARVEARLQAVSAGADLGGTGRALPMTHASGVPLRADATETCADADHNTGEAHATRGTDLHVEFEVAKRNLLETIEELTRVEVRLQAAAVEVEEEEVGSASPPWQTNVATPAALSADTAHGEPCPVTCKAQPSTSAPTALQPQRGVHPAPTSCPQIHTHDLRSAPVSVSATSPSAALRPNGVTAHSSSIQTGSPAPVSHPMQPPSASAAASERQGLSTDPSSKSDVGCLATSRGAMASSGRTRARARSAVDCDVEGREELEERAERAEQALHAALALLPGSILAGVTGGQLPTSNEVWQAGRRRPQQQAHPSVQGRQGQSALRSSEQCIAHADPPRREAFRRYSIAGDGSRPSTKAARRMSHSQSARTFSGNVGGLGVRHTEAAAAAVSSIAIVSAEATAVSCQGGSAQPGTGTHRASSTVTTALCSSDAGSSPRRAALTGQVLASSRVASPVELCRAMPTSPGRSAGRACCNPSSSPVRAAGGPRMRQARPPPSTWTTVRQARLPPGSPQAQSQSVGSSPPKSRAESRARAGSPGCSPRLHWSDQGACAVRQASSCEAAGSAAAARFPVPQSRWAEILAEVDMMSAALCADCSQPVDGAADLSPAKATRAAPLRAESADSGERAVSVRGRLAAPAVVTEAAAGRSPSPTAACAGGGLSRLVLQPPACGPPQLLPALVASGPQRAQVPLAARAPHLTARAQVMPTLRLLAPSVDAAAGRH